MTEPKGDIKKANLTSTVKFLWLIVRYCLPPTAAENIVTWDRAVLMAAMIAGFEVDFVWLLQAVMHERAFKVTTTYPFPCIIFLYADLQVCLYGTLISSRPLWALLILASSEMRPMSWLHAEGPIQSCPHLLTILLIR